MNRPLVPLVVCLLLTATALGMIGIATTLRQSPVVIVVTATAEPTFDEQSGGAEVASSDSIAAGMTMPSPGGPVTLRVDRLTLAPGTVLPSGVRSVPTVLIAELGVVGVQTYDVEVGRRRHAKTETDTVLQRGDSLVVDLGMVRTVRNAGSAPAVVLVVAIEPEPDCQGERPCPP